MWQSFLQFGQQQWNALAQWNSLVEIGFLAAGIYYIYIYFRGTRAARVLTGMMLFLISLTVLSEALNLVFELAHRRFGALLAIERDIGLRNYAESGVDLDAAFSSELLLTIFHPKTALHDGGVILRDSRIVAAACIFPVSQRESLDRSFGLRHRAGLGLSEETDALALVVSEETGSVSLCNGRTIRRGLTRPELRRLLGQALLFEGGPAASPAVAMPAASPADNRDAA